jgi:hypothetical protein
MSNWRSSGVIPFSFDDAEDEARRRRINVRWTAYRNFIKPS